jgi:putative ABC transport system substrate-binding protein
MKKTFILVITVIVVIVIVFHSTRISTHKPTQPLVKKKTVAIVVPVTIRAIQSFVDQVRTTLESKQVELLHFSAEGDPTRFESVIKAAILKKPDVLILFGTQLTDTALGPQFKDSLPKVIASAISSPNTLDSLVDVGINPPRKRPISIITDSPKQDIYSQSAGVIKQLLSGKDTTAGILFNESEKNSSITASCLKQELEKNGVTVYPGVVSGSDDVLPVAKSLLVQGSKVLIIPHDKYVLPKAKAIVKLCNEYLSNEPLPVFSLDDGVVRDSGVALSVSVSYKRLGELTATTTLDILNGEDPAAIPVQALEKASVYVNLEALDLAKSQLPKDVMRDAIIVKTEETNN